MSTILEDIKKKGYWKIRIIPGSARQDRFSMSKLRDLIGVCKVRLRGWDYPHLDPEHTRNFSEYLQSYCQFLEHYEIWRFYKSGQFIHYFSMKEDWIDQIRIHEILKYYSNESDIDPDRKGLSILSTLYSLSEIYEFAVRLASKDVLGSELTISIDLFGLTNRQLFFFDSDRDLFYSYISEEEHFSFQRNLNKDDLISSASELALENFLELLHVFQWNDPSLDLFQEEQRKFLQRRL